LKIFENCFGGLFEIFKKILLASPLVFVQWFALCSAVLGDRETRSLRDSQPSRRRWTWEKGRKNGEFCCWCCWPESRAMSFVVVMMRKHRPTTTGQRTHTRRRIDPFFQLRAERDVPIGATIGYGEFTFLFF
jgi:hypothetical protein